MQTHCHFTDDASSHFVQCWVGGGEAEFPMPDPVSPTWRACHCFQSNSCLGGMEREKPGVLGSMPAARRSGRCDLQKGVWGLV